MIKTELYISILLIYIILISVFWKTESEFKNNQLISEVVTPKSDFDLEEPSDSTNIKVKKGVPNGKGWMESYKYGIRFDYSPKWNFSGR